MSLNSKAQLVRIAKKVCRELRKNSTHAEKLFWETVRSKKFKGKKFYRQYPIFFDVTGKESFFVADFYCYEERLVIELDGGYHQYKLTEDKNRSEILESLGLRVLRFNNEDIVYRLDEVLTKI